MATPSVTPVVFAWVEQLRQTYEGQAVVRNGDELQVLDAPFSGQLFFDVNTGKVSVSSYSANSVEDQTACSPYTLSGFPLYGLNPGCRDIGQNPDRTIGVVRPVMGNQGFLYAHNRVIPAGPGLPAEITPVEIDPAVLPETLPSDLRYLSFRRVPASNDCTPATLEWYESTGLLPVGADELTTTTVTYTELQDVTKAFNFLVTRLVDDKWITYRLTNESFKDLIEQSTTSGLTWLTEPQTLLIQHKSSMPGGGGSLFHPTIVNASPMPVVNQATTVNLTTIEGYTAEATYVILDFRLVVSSSSNQSNYTLTASGREYAKAGTTTGPLGVDCCYNQVMVKIPSNKILPLNLYVDVGLPGAMNYFLGQIDIMAFGK